MNSPAELDVRPGKPSFFKRLSLIWLVPIAALAVSLGVAWQSYQDQGSLITITFENGSGIKAAETQIRYRDITIGEVEEVKFTEDLKEVEIHARIDKGIAPFLDQDAQFWVVRPDVSVRGITGLDTVLGGVYIEATFNDDADVTQYEFTGLETPPLTRAGQRGTEIVLRAKDGSSLTKGAPILFRGIQVGSLETPEIDGNGVRVSAFIESPFDRRITTATRFWNTSGFSVSVGASGLALNVSSLASLIEGGIAFDTIVSGGQPIRDGQVYDLFDAEDAARESLFIDPNQEIVNVSVLFDGSVSGLAQGSEVRYRGLRVGQVADLNAEVADVFGNQVVRLRTTLAIEPARLGLPAGSTDAEAVSLISDLVGQGLRARLISGSVFSSSLTVELVEVPEAPTGTLDLTGDPYPIMPTTTNEVTDMSATAEGVMTRINNLPIEEVMNGAIDLMASIEALAANGSLQEAPEELLAILKDVRTLTNSADIQGLPAELQAILARVDGVVADVGGITQQAADADLAGRLSASIDTATQAVANLDSATGNLPEILTQVEALAVKANGLELEALVAQTTQTLSDIDALIASEAATALPGSVNAALDEVRGLVADVREGGAVENLNAALASASQAATAVETASVDLPVLTQQASDLLSQIEAATENLPQITAEIEALTAKANSLEVEALVAQTTETLTAIETFIASEDTAALPGALSDALGELQAVLQEVRDGGAIVNVNAALQSANDAAQAIEEAARSLPALSGRAAGLMTQTGAVLENYGERGRFNAETLATLRDIQAAADAVSSLARAIQRNPNSLLTGR